MNKEKAIALLTEFEKEIVDYSSYDTKNSINKLYKYISSIDLSIKSMPRLSPQYDFNIVEKQIKICYRKVDCVFDIDEVINIFRYYTEQYKIKFGSNHPNMKNPTIEKILENLQTCTPTDGVDRDIEYNLCPDDYPALINEFFEMQIPGNYSIALFIDGDFRGNILRSMGGGV